MESPSIKPFEELTDDDIRNIVTARMVHTATDNYLNLDIDDQSLVYRNPFTDEEPGAWVQVWVYFDKESLENGQNPNYV